MVAEWITALAASIAGGLVSAATTDAWQSSRDRLARLLGRGDTRREAQFGARLDTTAAEIARAPQAELETTRSAQAAIWRARLTDVLEDEPTLREEFEALSSQLRAAVAAARPNVESHHNAVQVNGDNALAVGSMSHSTLTDNRGKYRIGNIHFGNGGLTVLILLAVLLLGGGTAGVIHAVSAGMDLDEVAGRWTYQTEASGIRTDTTLDVTVPQFVLAMDIYQQAASGERTGIHVECMGEVTEGDGEAIFHVHFRAHQPIGAAAKNLTSECPDWFSGVPDDAGTRLSLSSPSGQPIVFQRAGRA